VGGLSAHRLAVVVVADAGGQGPDQRWHIGDEAMLASNLALLRREPRIRVVVASSAPDATTEAYGVHAVPLPELRPGADGPELAALETALVSNRGAQPETELSQAIAGADVVWFSGAGNLTSVFRDRLLERVAIGRAASLAGARVVLTGQTIGPDLDKPDRDLVRELLALASHVGVRDAPSMRLARDLGADAVAQLDDAFTFADVIDMNLAPSQSPRLIGVTLHHSPASGSGIEVISAAARLDELCRAVEAQVAFMPHFTDGPGIWADALLMHEVGRAMEAPHQHVPLGRPEDAVHWTRLCSLIVSTRYHPVVFGLRCGVPTLCLAQDAYHEVKLGGATEPYERLEWVMQSARLLEPGALADPGTRLVGSARVRRDLKEANQRLALRARAERLATLEQVVGASQ
jgi:polysaccharide pyruvyl transferase WcaK-like protein